MGPRTPFAQDPIFDYSYDSGDDWQDDEGGEDVDDFDGSVVQDEEESEAESEGEFDDWLDDSEDPPFVPGEVLEDTPHLAAGPSTDQGRLPMKVVKKAREIPKKVVKVTPSWKGPMWEQTVGVCCDGFDGYSIQLLNGERKSLLRELELNDHVQIHPSLLIRSRTRHPTLLSISRPRGRRSSSAFT